MAYISQADLSARLGAQALIAFYDDDGSSTINSAALNSVCVAASARVDAYISRNYRGILPLTVSPLPAMVVEAALEWAVYMSFRRKPEYVKAYYGDAGLLALMKSAEDFSERLAKAEMLMPDLTTTEPQPTNVGGKVVPDPIRLFTPNADGTSNSGDF